ncbi:enoyl-CoA hydratase-related protein [Roseovarius azorensis]|uniref:enoyl-CoA hydratase-related protein n=1 Tax=Roseovarius azorensis TaxID=1287727 RepID=UPI001587936B|nr:enoyl-CoA hydratase-related protein [Roseovarius azorensis]
MTRQIQLDTQDGVRIVRLDRPVANALTPDLRADLLQALREAAEDSACRAVVICGIGPGFSSGVDLTEYDQPAATPSVSALCAEIEAFPKPVVVALHGAALGAALALVLAAHARVAQAGAQIALPEIGLGMMPGAGVTQRLPRLAGAGVALDLMLSGQTVRTEDPRLADVFDRLVGIAPEAEAVALARRLADEGQWRRSCDCERGLEDPLAYRDAIAAAEQKLQKPSGAAGDILRAVEAAQLLPFTQGLNFEQVLFDERLQSPEARAQRYVYAAERRAGGMPELRGAEVRPLRRIALSGTGLGDVAMAFLEAGREVRTEDADLARQVRQACMRAVRAGRMETDEMQRRLARLVPERADDWADLVLDGRAEVVPQGVPARPAESGITALLDSGAGLGGARLGLRLYRPAQTLKLAEIAVGEGAAAGDVASLARLCAETGRTALRAALPAAGPGLGHVMMGVLCLAALDLVREGLTPLRVDQAAQRLGLRHGPFLLMDIEGLAQVAQRLGKVATMIGARPPDRDGPLAERLARGATGRVAGRGFYDHPPEGPRPSRDMAGTGLDPGEVPGGVAPRDALHAALVNGAARLLAAGAVQRASDLDVLMVRGYGYERLHGGPLFQADQRGLLAVLKDMKALRAVSEPLWAPQPMIEAMVRNGEGFFGRVALAVS